MAQDVVLFVVLLMGTGIGSGIIANGKLFELIKRLRGGGHTTINPTGPCADIGNYGCMSLSWCPWNYFSLSLQLSQSVLPHANGNDQIEHQTNHHIV